MTCRKGEFYILKGDYTPGKVSGYIINEKIGFTRSACGKFYPTELKSGMSATSAGWAFVVSTEYNGVYNLSNAYKAFVDCKMFDRVDERLLKPSQKMKKCMAIIKKAYEADKE